MEGFDVVIQAGKGSGSLSKVWRFRELFLFLAWRDILVRYKQTLLGVAWAVLRPLATMLAFTFAFGKVAKLPSEGYPYLILVGAGTLPWQLFSTGLSEIGESVVGNANLIKKVYFPRIIIPISSMIVALTDMLFALGVLAACMAYYGVLPDWRVVVLPVFILLGFLFTVSLGLWIAALNVRYRDFRYLVPFGLQLALFVSPVGFSSSVIPEKWRLLYSLNPMVGVIDGFRWCLLKGSSELYLPSIAVSVVFSVGLLLLGVRYFHRMERTFADII